MSVAAPASSPPATTLRHRYPATYWVLVGGFGVSRIGAVLVPYLTLYLVIRLHMSTAAAGQVLAAFGGGWVIGQPLAGVAADRIGRKATISGSLLLTAGAYLLLTSVTTLPALCLLAALIGLVFDGPRTALTAWITDLLPAERRTRGLGIQYWLLNIGGAIAGALGAFLANQHITWLCTVDATTCAALAVVVLLLHEAPRVLTTTTNTTARRFSALRDKRLLTATALSLGTLTVYQQMVYGLPLTIHHDGLSATVYGTVNVVNGVSVLALQPLLQPLIDRIGPLRSCSLGALAIGLGMGANALAHNAVSFAAAAIIWTIGEIAFYVGASSYVANLAPEHARGRYLGIWGGSLGASALLAPLVGAAALSHGTWVLWTGAAAIGTACAIGFAAQPSTTARP